ncbi:hypothetical protein [Streptomyces mutomycini]|uniref:hypothetical protein n=1 Tax=Streptomyces mutomycini TaxID=284036 RepID=UPI0033C6DE62
MAVTGSGRGPIKVGSGYIDVFLKLNHKQYKEIRNQITKQMGATGKQAGKLLADGLEAGAKKGGNAQKREAEKAKAAQQKIAKKAQAAFERIEREITKQYGQQAADRFRTFGNLEEKKAKLLRNARAADKKALQDTVRAEEKASRDKARSWQIAEKERLRLLRERERAERQAHLEEARRWETAQRSYMRFLRDRRVAAERAAREEAAAHRRAHLQMREDLRQTLAAARTARLADLRGQMDTHRNQLVGLRDQLRNYRRQMDDHTRSVGRSLTGLQTSWRRQGEAIERLGTNVTEAGRLVSMNLLAPLGAVAGMLTTIGVKSADMRILGQMGLGAAGVSKKQSAAQMEAIQKYAIDTPFSIDTMHEYQMKLIRSIAGNDNEWYKKDTKSKAADKAAGKTTDIIKAIGDTMARAGNLDPEMFKRAMYATDRIMDMNKAPTRNINQLVQATGIPAGELARMFGFKDAGAFWKQVGTPVAKGGGISGQDMIDNLLEGWDPNYFKLDKNGNRVKDPKSGQWVINKDSSREGGSAGYGERMTSATITGRISQIKERAQFELGSLFAQENKKTGEYEYTDLGQSIMGKATGKDKNGNTVYEGGLLEQVKELGSGQKDNIVALISTSIEGLSVFVEQIQKLSDWLAEHPEIRDAFASILKIAAVALPFIIAMGLATKVLGKFGKIFNSGVITPAAAAGRGVRGATRLARQGIAGNEVENATRSRLEAERDARRAQSGNRGTLRERMRENRSINRQSRQAGNQAYRDRRTQLRDGDTRGPMTRLGNRITGRDSGSNQLRTQMRETEDAISETEEAIRSLQRQIRDVNGTSVRQLVDRFAGTGNGTLQGAANTAGTQVNNVTTQVGQLNRAGLGTVGGEVNGLRNKAEELHKQIEKSKTSMGELNGKNLNGLKLAVDSAHGTVGDLKDKVENTALEVSALNRKELGKLSGEFRSSTSSADSLQDKIKATIKSVGSLNGAKLGGLRKEFGTLKTAVNNVHTLVGTSKSGLHGRVTNLDNRSLSKVIKAVKDLKDALSGADKKADSLNNSLNDISNKAPGKGGSTGPSKKTKRATGGVLPGYTPGQDVHVFSSPTAGELHLSGGEAVMRPEVTAALGHERINQLNMAARTRGVEGVRQVMQFKDGGVLGKLGLDHIVNLVKNYNLGTDVIGANRTVGMYSSSDALGGDTQKGMKGSGRKGANFIGSDVGGKFRGVYDFMTNDVYDLLRKAPIPNGVSQVIGLLGGAIAPVSAQYFWDDVWKGQGNILERGQEYMGDMFSMKTLSKVVDNLFGGAWDTAKSLWAGGKALITDPVGTFKEGVGGVWEMVQGSYNGVVDSVKGLREIMQNPLGYGAQVAGEVFETAKENLPNMKKLFDFSGDGLHSAPPDVSKLLETGGPGTGRALKWARTQNGKRYQWGGNGNPSWDCSGFMSAIESVIRGQKPHRRWATGSFRGSSAPDGWVRGLKSPFMIGITNAGVGHTAGTLNGVNVESRGGDGVVVGPRARGWNSSLFTDVYGFRSSVPKGYWTGTQSASPGLALVGERGPELVDFKGGERVYDTADTASLLSSDSRPIYITVNEAKSENTTQAVMRAFQHLDTMYGSKI